MPEALLLAVALLATSAADAGAAPQDDPNGPSCALSGDFLRAYGIATPWADLARMAVDAGAAPLRPDLFQRPGDRATPLCADGPVVPIGRVEVNPAPAALRLDLVPASLWLYGNTAYPSGMNDGAVWQGKGLSTQLQAGLQFRWGILSAAFVPTLAWQQNVVYPMIPVDRPGNLAYSNPFYGDWLDVPQRFGGSPFWTLSPGQSYVQVDYAGFGAGISTENLWWGPGQHTSLLMTNNAGGFPHAYAGTVRPVDVWVGNLEANLWLGSLGRSDYFYTKDRAWFAAVTGDLELRWVRGLYLGGVYARLSSVLCGSCQDNTNSFVGVYGRWVLPPAGFEVYGEWTRDDAWIDLADLTKELDHSAGYTIGLQKVFLGTGYWVRLLAEISDVDIPRPARSWRPDPTSYYVHGGNTNYTNGGQILGAAMGPGGSTQYLGLDVLTPAFWLGAFVERTRRNDVYFTYVTPDGNQDVEVGGGLRFVGTFGDLDVGAVTAFYQRSSHDGIVSAFNYHAEITLTWWPGKSLATVWR